MHSTSGVHDHALQLFGFDRFDGHPRVDGGLEQLLQTFFAQVAPKPADVGCVTRQPVFVGVQAAEELPEHILAPAYDKFLFAEVEAVLEVQQARHRADRQLGAPGVAHARTFKHPCGAERVVAFEDTSRVILALKLGPRRGLDLIPRQPSRQQCQRVTRIDHRVDASGQKVGRLHPQIPQKSIPQRFVLEEIGMPSLPAKACVHAGSQGFAGPTL